MGTVLIRGGTVVSPTMSGKADIFVKDGAISAIYAEDTKYSVDADRTIDVTGLHIFPGFIDPHVHIGNYRDFRRDSTNQTRAAATGGVTTLFTFLKPAKHRQPEASFFEFIGEVVTDIDETAYVDVGMHAVISSVNHIAEIPQVAKMGLTSFKFYMGYRGDAQALKRGSVALDDGQIFLGYKAVGETGVPAVAMTHAENEDVNKALLANLLEETENQPTLQQWFRTRPDFAEAEVTWSACSLAVGANSPLYVVHVSSSAALEAIKEHRRRSSANPLYAEATTHHLLLNEYRGEHIATPAAAKTTPPLRPQRDLDLLWQAIVDGVVDTVGSDTCPVDPTDKADVISAEPGFSAIDIFPALMLTEGPRRGVSLERISEVCSSNTAKIFGVHPRKGCIAPGADADLAIFDLDSPWTYDPSAAESDSYPSPYEGWEFTARNVITLLRGEVIYEDGQLASRPSGRALVEDPN